ncbi:MAG: hypothetical protein ACYCUG_14460 [Acidimicrobiales bacterium]
MARSRDLIGMGEAAALAVRAGLPGDLFVDMAERGVVEVFDWDGRALLRREEIEQWCRAHGPAGLTGSAGAGLRKAG